MRRLGKWRFVESKVHSLKIQKSKIVASDGTGSFKFPVTSCHCESWIMGATCHTNQIYALYYQLWYTDPTVTGFYTSIRDRATPSSINSWATSGKMGKDHRWPDNKNSHFRHNVSTSVHVQFFTERPAPL